MKVFRFVLPLLVIGGAAVLAKVLIELRPEPEKVEPKPYRPAVEVVVVEPRSVSLTVKSQGTVQARTETMLTSEVSGKILEVSENFRPGGFFEAGELLVRIDSADYEAAYSEREAALLETKFKLAEEQAMAEQARLDWQAMGQGDASDLTLRVPQVARAEAALKSAQAALSKAERDLERTRIMSPYAGMVLEKHVDVGQFVSGQPGTQLAKIFSIATAEVRLPITLEDTVYLNLPQNFREGSNQAGPAVSLTARIKDKMHQWEGRIIRSEAAIDTRSRLLYLVAGVSDPYARTVESSVRPPLMMGMFVEAVIHGVEVSDAFVVPRQALIDQETVLVVKEDNTLFRRPVQVIQSDGKRAIIKEGLSNGDRVVVSPLEYIVDGMEVQPEAVPPELYLSEL